MAVPVRIISPSHMMIDRQKLQNASHLFENDDIHACNGLANWSEDINIKIDENKGSPTLWFVSHWLLNNKDIIDLKQLREGKLYLEGFRGGRSNILREYMNIDDVTFLASHTLKILDNVVKKTPNIKLIFWCLYERTKNNKSKIIPIEYQYDAMFCRYYDNVLDIDNSLKILNVKFSDCIIDSCGHPNLNGYTVIRHAMDFVKQ